MSIKDFYDENGYVLLKNAIPNDLIEKYEQVWMKHVAEQRDEGIYFRTP
jgi:predicted butyrate kinase (DUF1464 family)